MMRFLPKSLYGRLVIVLLGGLLAAQALTMFINRAERDQLLYRAGGMRLAQRIVDIAKLLDTLPPSQRPKVVALFAMPPLRVSLDSPALAPSEDDADFRAAMLKSVLHHQLGDEAKIVVRRPAGEAARPPPGRHEREPMFGPHGMAAAGMPPPGPPGLPLLVQVGLADGTLVSFDTTLSPQSTNWPWRLAASLLVMLASVGALSWLAVRWLTGPLSALAHAADRLGENIDGPALAESGPTEVRRAARAFNTMQQRLSRFITERTRLLTAMSHDLKTPLTRLRLRSEMLDDDKLRAKFSHDLDEMEAMVRETLEFMRDADSREALAAVDLMALLESMQTDYRDTGKAVDIVGASARPCKVRPLALRRCLANLLDNALRYGERAIVEIEDGAARIVLKIRDRGPGIPEAELEQVFEPFYRGEASRSRETGGTGLGLGIARNIARAHGGDIVLRNLPAGGLEATLSLPR